MHEFSFDVYIFQEDGVFVAHALGLDVSSCGDTREQARHNIREAVAAFLEAAQRMGTLCEVLKERADNRPFHA